jgi:uncharacterized protein YoxC
MKTNIILSIVLMLAFLSAGAQHDSISLLQNEVNALKSNSRILQKGHNELMQKIEAQNHRIDSLEKAVQNNAVGIQQTATSLDTKISENKSDTDHNYEELRACNWMIILFGIIGFIVAVLLSVILFIVLGKRQKKGKEEVINQMNETKKNLEEEIKKLNGKLTEMSEAVASLTKKIEEKPDKNKA